MTRRPCDCEHCTQDRLYRQKEVTRLYSEKVAAERHVDRHVSWVITLFFALAILGVAASWWVRT